MRAGELRPRELASTRMLLRSLLKQVCALAHDPAACVGPLPYELSVSSCECESLSSQKHLTPFFQMLLPALLLQHT